ncbi:MAG TPA: Gfo/Idh/MocA family oxidoreductase [Vicinamibacterales bacterium]|nr:Gfo/Idh/MocA family oxidoreductase [Vicinamibacterales bacterium]
MVDEESFGRDSEYGDRRAAAMSPAAILRVGLAGAGWVTPHHLRAWARLAPRATVVAIADPDVAAARARAGEFGIPVAYDSVEAMLDAETLDAVDVATPREAHAPVCRMAAARGLAILCQKPLAPAFAEARQLVGDVGGRSRLMVHENWRFRPHYRQIRSWLDDERLGDVRTVTMSVLTSGFLPDANGVLPALGRQPMLATLDRLLLMEVLIHHVDTLRFLVGPMTLTGAQLGRSSAAVRGEDRATLFMTTAAGAAVSLVGDFMAYGHPPEAFDRLAIYGTRGAITLERDRLRIDGERSQEVQLDLPANYAASYAAAIAHFVDRLEDGRPFETGPDDNLETLRIVEAAYAAGGFGG